MHFRLLIQHFYNFGYDVAGKRTKTRTRIPCFKNLGSLQLHSYVAILATFSIRSAKSAWINLLHQDAQDAAGNLATPP